MAGKVLVIGGTSCNVGKTSLALGIMVALRRMGLSVQPFKIGPAFTDPMQHHLVSGSPYINLDSWLMGKDALLRSVHELSAGCDIALVEGAMGLFDGLDNRSEDGSTAQVAKWLGAPVLLVLDTWSVGRSAAAIIKGYQQFDQSVDLAGVLFNRITDSEQLRVLKDALDGADVGLPVLGGVPKDDLMPQEAMLQDAPAAAGALLEHVARLVEQHVDLQRLLACAKPLQPAQPQLQPAAPFSQRRTRIAVAQDAAFCFYYRENLALLQQSGAELVPFSPLQEQQLPASVSGIYLGGGYPELYSQQLAANICMLASVRAFAAAGGVIFAECGGLMYLGQSIEQQHGSVDRMAGVFSYRTRMTSGPLRSGYLEVDVLHGCPLFPAGAKARGYMSHLCEVVQEVCQSLGAEPAASEGSTAGSSSSEQCSYSARVVHSTKAGLQAKDAVAEGYTAGRALASLVHLHFSSCPQLAQALVEACCQVDVAAAAAAATEAVTAACTQQLLAARPGRSIASAKSLPDLQAAATAALAQHSRLPRVLSQGTLSPERSTYKQEGAARMRHSKSLSMESGLEVAPEVARRLHAKLHGPAILAAGAAAGAAGPAVAAGGRGSPARLANWAAGIPGSIEAVASRVQHMLQQKGVPAEAASAAAAGAAVAGTGSDHTEQLLNSHLPVLGRSHAKGIGLAVPISRSSSSSNICVSGAAAAVMMQQLVPLGGKPPMAPLNHPSPLHVPSCDKEPAVLSAPLEHKLASSQRASFSSQSSPELWILGRPSAQFSHGSSSTTDSLGELSGGKLSKLSSTYSDYPHQPYHSHQQHPFNALAAGITPADEGYSSAGLPALPALPAVKAGRTSMQHESPRKLRPSLQQQQPLTPQQQQQRQQAFHLPSALASASRAAAAGRRRRPLPLALHHIHNDTIVSLCPAATDTVLAMGLSSRLVARTDMCDLPLDLADTPLVANLKLDPSRLSAADTVAKAQELAASGETLHKLDEGWLREEQPGVVLVPASGSPYDVDGASVLQALERAGLLRADASTTIVCHECYSMADVLQFALLVGQAAGVPEAAAMVVERLRARLRRLRGLTLQAPKQPRVLVLESVHPLVAAGHWAAEVQALAGAAACFPQQAQDRPRALTWEEVRRMAPEVLVISQHLQRAERAVLEVADLAAQPGWWSLPAVRSGQVYVVDCSLVSRPGPRLVDGAEVLGSLLHPQLVPRKAGLQGLVLKLSLSAGQRCRHCLVPNYFVAW